MAEALTAVYLLKNSEEPMQFICLLFISPSSPMSITHVCTEPNTHPHSQNTCAAEQAGGVTFQHRRPIARVIFNTYFSYSKSHY